MTSVATALNHISLIEMPEPITNAAMGSEDFRIEWHGNTVALKPLRQGQSTNLFIWTEHGQSSYEILAPGEVSTAAFVIDQTEGPAIAAKQPGESSQGGRHRDPETCRYAHRSNDAPECPSEQPWREKRERSRECANLRHRS